MELRLVIAVGEPRGTVLLLHGYGEHAGRYSALIESFAAGGYDVFFYDQDGHGTAPGRRGCSDVGELISHHMQARRATRARMRTTRLVLFGHSMGGLVTAASALIDPAGLDAVVLSGPAFRQFPELPGTATRIGYALASVFPSLPVAALDSGLISTDPKVVRDYDNDPLVFHGNVPLLTGASMAVQGQKALDHANRWPATLPLLVFHGSADGLANIAGSRAFVSHARANGAPADFVTVDGAYHEVFKEPEHKELEDHMLWWLDQQIPAGRQARASLTEGPSVGTVKG
ncbi:alpha/beta hydrolase [Flaviflexus equikiangi]|uniref:Lysophospholipase n=1 Tax=Flaviflexus equikiangi TaxID=2758573 RepID=A0ABS2TCW1_9ACTO|nr:alpha/beta hydrolase [Flaviflexus equikiangi]MBM9432477.1 lysophospholipase [Flaviflexus equikiangi]